MVDRDADFTDGEVEDGRLGYPPRGHAWRGDEALERFELAPWKTEMVAGKLYDRDEQRLNVLGLLLENMGADAAVRVGDPAVWRAAIAALDRQ